MAVDEFVAMDWVREEQGDNDELNYHPKSSNSSF
jgi:hypothetical protein